MQEFKKNHGGTELNSWGQSSSNHEFGGTYHKAFSIAAKHAIAEWVDEVVARPRRDPEAAPRTEEQQKELREDLLDTYNDIAFGKPNPEEPELDGLVKFGKLDGMIKDVENHGKMQPDQHAHNDAVDAALELADQKEFEQYVRGKLAPVEKDQYIPKYSETTGRRWKIPYNLSSVVKEMTRTIRQGENFNYGLGTARSAGARRFRSMKEMVNAHKSIVPKATFEAHKEKMDKRFGDLADELSGYHGGDSFHKLDALAEAIGESYKRGKSISNELHLSGYENVPRDLQQKVYSFAQALLASPTEYFEAKPQRAVGIHEFHGAAVPEGAHPDVLDVLKLHSLDVERYKKDVPGDRSAAINRLALKHKLHLAEMAMSKSEPQTTVFRGLEHSEHEFMRQHGHILSDQRYCAPGEGTCFGHDHDTGEGYVNHGHTNPVTTKKPTYVVEVDRSPDMPGPARWVLLEDSEACPHLLNPEHHSVQSRRDLRAWQMGWHGRLRVDHRSCSSSVAQRPYPVGHQEERATPGQARQRRVQALVQRVQGDWSRGQTSRRVPWHAPAQHIGRLHQYPQLHRFP